MIFQDNVINFVIFDLIRLSQYGNIICDCHLTVEEAEKITDQSRIVLLLKDTNNLVDEYCNRPDHQDFSNFIHSASGFEKAKAVCNETLKSLNDKRYYDIKSSNFFWLERDNNRSVEDTVKHVEEHFGWRLPDDEIKML